MHIARCGLERLHQTLKIMLQTYSLEFEREQTAGAHLQRFAAREVGQESLGSQSFIHSLFFANRVCGRPKLLKEKWRRKGTEINLLDNVSNCRLK